MQFNGKIVNQTWENSKNLIFGLSLARLAQAQAKNYNSRCNNSLVTKNSSSNSENIQDTSVDEETQLILIFEVLVVNETIL